MIDEIRLDTGSLYREESFTDLKVGSIRRLVPVTTDGNLDPSRPVRFVGQTQLMSQLGPLPVQCSIEAANLAEAIERFPMAIKLAVDELVAEAREMQRREMSRIVAPSAQVTSKILTGK
ncbi:MAG: hypothetical protein C3F15_08125 [Holophagae bacterium]|nr:MAG: hypothetical protein C3F15_08125 [Holophagae bacterium]